MSFGADTGQDVMKGSELEHEMAALCSVSTHQMCVPPDANWRYGSLHSRLSVEVVMPP